ncbi:MAG: transporter [Caulobacter sp.]|nr:transporter [Caulobacter sp.]
MSHPPILTVSGAKHAFVTRQVLRGVDLSVSAGEIYALLGPNGAGKTTLLRAICGRLRLKEGEVRLAGQDPWSVPAARAGLGLVPQDLALYPHMTVRENLQTFARLSLVKGPEIEATITRAMALTRTADRAHVPVKHLSGGYQRRVNIAAAILHEPKVLILDEPTVGVDVDAREAVDNVIRGLRDIGVAVLLTTHDLEQADGLADRVGFMREGRMMLEGSPRDLITHAFGEDMEILVHLVQEPDTGGEIRLAAEGLNKSSGNLWVKLDPGGYAAAGKLDTRLRKLGLTPREIRVRQPSLQNLFTLIADRKVAI